VSKSVPIRAGLDLPALAEPHAVRRTVKTALRRRRGVDDAPERGSHAHWRAGTYGLDRTRAYKEATGEQRRAVLEDCGRALLEEAYFIEKCGIGYAAKMILLSESSCERQLYALIAGDEAAHLSSIGRFYQGEGSGGPFLALLEELVEEGDRHSLQLIVQVVLEGWGLDHYRVLRDTCTSHPLRRALSVILADEATHHGSGVALVRDAVLSAESVDYATDLMARFLAMVQPGPLAVIGAVDRALGGLTAEQRTELWNQLGGASHAGQRLEKLRQLMGKVSGALPVLSRLEAAGCFRPTETA
jgi:hypothetical protein